MNDGGGNGASCVGIKVRTDTTKLSDMVVARFGDGRNLICEGKMFKRFILTQLSFSYYYIVTCGASAKSGDVLSGYSGPTHCLLFLFLKLVL